MEYMENAYAKLNLTLDILGKRPDGYHDMSMVMQSVQLWDDVTITPQMSTGLSVSTNLYYLPNDDNNIAAKAVRKFFAYQGEPCPNLAITLDKKIPVCAGMAGGSSDGAAVLRILKREYAPDMPREELERIAASVGSDVPYCVRGGTVLAQGRGEILTDLPPMPDCWFVICKPDFPISTPELFSKVRAKQLTLHPDTAGMLTALERKDLEGVAHYLYNVFEEVLPKRCHQVFSIKSQLLAQGAMGASMTGSGPTVFGIFAEEEPARKAAEVLKKNFSGTFCCRNHSSSLLCP